MSKIEVSNRKSAFVELRDFCTFSMTIDNVDFLEVTEWTNGEGYDIHISDVNGQKKFELTHGQLNAIKKCVKAINKDNIKVEL